MFKQSNRVVHFKSYLNVCLQDLAVRLTDDTDPFFLYNLVISEEDFQR